MSEELLNNNEPTEPRLFNYNLGQTRSVIYKINTFFKTEQQVLSANQELVDLMNELNKILLEIELLFLELESGQVIDLEKLIQIQKELNRFEEVKSLYLSKKTGDSFNVNFDRVFSNNLSTKFSDIWNLNKLID